MSAEPLHKTLWQENQALAEECLAHPFVRGLGDGSLDPEVFKHYVAQDAFFLQAFFSAYAPTVSVPGTASRAPKASTGLSCAITRPACASPGVDLRADLRSDGEGLGSPAPVDPRPHGRYDSSTPGQSPT